MTNTNPKSKRKRTEDELKQDRRIKHGGYSAQTRKRYSDERTTEGKQLRQIIKDLTDDLGGPSSLTAAQRLLLDTLQSKLIVILQIGKFVDSQPEIIRGGELLPVLGKNYLAYLNSIRLTLAELYKDHHKHQKRGPTLQEIIEAESK